MCRLVRFRVALPEREGILRWTMPSQLFQQIGRITFIRLQSPDKTWTVLGKRIHFIPLGNKIRHPWIVEKSNHLGDVELGDG